MQFALLPERRDAVLEHEDVEAAHERAAGRGVDAAVRDHAPDDERVDLARAQVVLERGSKERVVARLSHHELVVLRLEAVDELPSPRARDELVRGPSLHLLPAEPLGEEAMRRRVGVRAHRPGDGQAERTGVGDERPDPGGGVRTRAHVEADAGEVPVDVAEVVLQVDDEQRRAVGLERDPEVTGDRHGRVRACTRRS
jgi:hypothetical protein